MYAHEYICFFTKYEYFMYILVSLFFTRFFASFGPVHILGFAGSMTIPVPITLLQRFGMQDCKSMSVPMTTNLTKLRDSTSSSQSVDSTLYRQLIGSLMYLMHTRPNICYTVNAPSQFMSDSKHILLAVAKHVLRYVWGTITYELRYTSSSGVLLSRYSDSDWAGSQLTEKVPLVIALVWDQQWSLGPTV